MSTIRSSRRPSQRPHHAAAAPAERRFHVFETPLGAAALAWTDHGVPPANGARCRAAGGEPDLSRHVNLRGEVPSDARASGTHIRVAGVILPGEATARAAAGRWPGAVADEPPREVKAVARRLLAHLAGRLDPLTDVVLDLDADASPFDRAVWAAAREVAPGTVATYGDLARRVGRPGAARAVGGAMGRNPVPWIIPCHRVVAASGIGGFSSSRGLKTKRAMLLAEGVEL